MNQPRPAQKRERDDAPLGATEPATLRPLHQVFSDMANWIRKRRRSAKARRTNKRSAFACHPK